MRQQKYAIGLDFGTLSVRALMIRIDNGDEVGESVFEYPHGVMEEALPTGEKLPPNWALQHPKDYLDGMIWTIREVMRQSGAAPEDVVGIGVDFTAPTVIPVRKDGEPLCFTEEFEHEPHAYVKLWKHHGAEKEAMHLEKVLKEKANQRLAFCSNQVSCEWMMPKIMETLNHAPKVYEKADRFMESMDWIVWRLTGTESRSMNGLNVINQTFYDPDTGNPSRELLRALDTKMEHFVDDKIHAPIKRIGETAGFLTEEMADILGLVPGVAVGTPIGDAHACLFGGGVADSGELMLVIGTSFCHMLLGEAKANVYGMCSCAKDTILQGYYTYEAGQSGGGEHYAWFVNNCVPEKYEMEAREEGVGIHQLLCEKLQGYKAGQSGLLALDWFNGVRSPLMDFDLNGLILGMNLQTKPEEIYLALIEATVFGTRFMVEEYEKAGVPIKSVVLSGGIPLKNPMLVQVFSDILNKDIDVCQTTQAGALGSAMLGIAAASSDITGYSCLKEVVKKLGKRKEKVCCPNEENVKVYHQLFEEYKVLHKYFGKGTNDVMKRLNQMRNS